MCRLICVHGGQPVHYETTLLEIAGFLLASVYLQEAHLEQVLNERQWRFLRAAQQAAGVANRFRWREVGALLGYDDEESRQIADFLERRVAIVLPTEREGQLLPLGRALILQWPPARAINVIRPEKVKPSSHRSSGRASRETNSPEPRHASKRGQVIERSFESRKRHQHKSRAVSGKGR